MAKMILVTLELKGKRAVIQAAVRAGEKYQWAPLGENDKYLRTPGYIV